MKRKIYFLLVGIFTIVSFSCAQVSKENEISVKQLKELMKTDSSLVILDVRTSAELEGPLGKIKGVINIPVQELNDRIGELAKYKDRNIAIICRTGHRSGIATASLLENGFKVKNVAGGMTAYRADEK